MKIPFTGMMNRRLLINWRVPPQIAQMLLPESLTPALVHGYAIAGLCLVRLSHLRPAGLPAAVGLTSENVAVRMGVQRETPEGVQKSVLIFRRESPAAANQFFCHHIGYGVHHKARLNVQETATRTCIEGRSPVHDFSVEVRPADDPGSPSLLSAFQTMDDAEAFFRGSECGYSPSHRAELWDIVRLHLHRWDLRPMAIAHARSSLIDELFRHTAQLDSAFIMRDIEHTWTPLGSVYLGDTRAALSSMSLHDGPRASNRSTGARRRRTVQGSLLHS